MTICHMMLMKYIIKQGRNFQMALNVKCPKCGSTKVQLSNESSKHGCLFTILFGFYYLGWLMIRWMIGFMILVCFDWWMAIIQAVRGNGYVWQGLRWFSNRRKVYFCHECGTNFRA